MELPDVKSVSGDIRLQSLRRQSAEVYQYGTSFQVTRPRIGPRLFRLGDAKANVACAESQWNYAQLRPQGVLLPTTAVG